MKYQHNSRGHGALVLGAGYAGLLAAQRLARMGAPVTLVDARATFGDRIHLHEHAVRPSAPRLLENVYPEIAAFLDKREAACRQLLSRAKKHVHEHRPRLAPTAELHQRMFHAFLSALQDGDTDALLTLLHDDVRVISDGGGLANAARNIVTGKDMVSRMLTGLHRLLPDGATHALAPVNGQPTLVTRSADGRAFSVMTIETDGALIYAVRFVLNPQKLRSVE